MEPSLTASVMGRFFRLNSSTSHGCNRVMVISFMPKSFRKRLRTTDSALLYLEKTRGTHATDVFLDAYRNALLEKNAGGQVVDSSGPIVLGTRLENSQQPTAWRAITYGKGTWIMQMLRRRLGDDRFLPMLKEILKRYDRA